MECVIVTTDEKGKSWEKLEVWFFCLVLFRAFPPPLLWEQTTRSNLVTGNIWSNSRVSAPPVQIPYTDKKRWISFLAAFKLKWARCGRFRINFSQRRSGKQQHDCCCMMSHLPYSFLWAQALPVDKAGKVHFKMIVMGNNNCCSSWFTAPVTFKQFTFREALE